MADRDGVQRLLLILFIIFLLWICWPLCLVLALILVIKYCATRVKSKYWLPPRRSTHGTTIKKLYHITQYGQEIRKSGEMVRGTHGIAGGGIYFAETVKEADYKSKSKGWLVTANVLVGNQYKAYFPNFRFTYQSLFASGYDSVLFLGLQSGNEHVVYNKDQVEILSVKPQ